MRVLLLGFLLSLTVACSTQPEVQKEAYVEDPVVQYVRADAAGMPVDITGCVQSNERCYVSGRPVDALIRFEPQTGRHWFLDAGTGNTYYTDGGYRSGDPFRAKNAGDLAGTAPEPGLAPPTAFGADEDL